MLKNKKKLIIIAVALLLVAAIVAGVFLLAPEQTIDRNVIAENAPKKNEAVYVEGSLNLTDDFTLVGKDGKLELYYNQTDYTLKIVNTETGYEWKSFVTDEEYIHNADKGKTENTEAVRKKLKRLFDISYTNFEEISKKTSLIEDGWANVVYHKLKNGFAIESNFDFGISVTVEFWLEDGGLTVRVPREKIKETSEYGISALTILPLLGATADTVPDSFVLFPDANGGVYDIKVPSGKQSTLISNVYFPRNFSLDDIEENNRQGIKNALLPYFGVSRAQNGFIGYITEGEMNGYVTLTPSGVVYNLTRIDASINYRKSYSYINPAGQTITEMEKNISAEDFGVHYAFTSAPAEDKVSYGDLAGILRDYLVKTGRLVKTESSKNDGVKVNLQMLMTTRVESMVAEFLQAMTTCEDIEKIVDSFAEADREQLRVMLLGWQSSGYNIYPSTGKIANNIGSLKNLCEYLNANKVENYTVEDYIYATTESANFSKQNDAVYNETNLPVTNSKGDQYVRNIYKSYLELTEKDIPYLSKRGVSGIALDKAGWYVFDDYQKNFETTRYEAVSTYNAMFKSISDAGMLSATQRGNAYVLNSVDYIYDVPAENSDFQLMDRNIPFYQMVIHGYIPYSLDTPGNMAIDYKVEKLKWIEYGAEPTFLLTQEMSELFKDSKVENAFSTEVANWLDDVQAIAKEFNTKLAFTGNNTIEDHAEVAENVYSVTYSNGKTVLVNYNQQKVTVDGVDIEALDYAVVDANIAG